jgi:tetratricopeptide (TPR) repeat protein
MPTVLGILRIDPPKEVQGHSLMPILQGKDGVASPLYAESFLPRLHFDWSELQAIQAQNYKFIAAPKPELYDIQSDPRETRNLYAEKGPLSDELHARLKKTIASFTPGEQAANTGTLDPALAERLQALGYAAFSGSTATKKSGKSLSDPKDRIQFYETFSEAMSEGQHGQLAEAIAKLNGLLEIEPDSIPVNYLLGLSYYKSQQFSEAERAFDKAVKLSPDYALANYYLGLAQARSGKLDAALVSFNRTLQLDPSNYSAAFNAGSAYMMQGKVGEAMNAFQRSIAISPKYAEGHRAIGEVLLYEGKVDPAIVELRRAVTLAPGDPRAHMSLAKALEAKGLHEEAQQVMRQARNAQAQRARQP